MGTGIGKDCRRCGEQLDYEDGFSWNETLCSKCESIVKFDNPNHQILSEELIEREF